MTRGRYMFGNFQYVMALNIMELDKITEVETVVKVGQRSEK